MHQRRAMSAVFIMLSVVFLSSGCSTLSTTQAEYDLTFRPVTGMRLAHDVSMEVSVSDGQERKPASKQSSKRVITSWPPTQNPILSASASTGRPCPMC